MRSRTVFLPGQYDSTGEVIVPREENEKGEALLALASLGLLRLPAKEGRALLRQVRRESQEGFRVRE